MRGVMRLPNGNRAIVAPTKITHYLLDDGHPDGGPKSRFLRSFGFDPASPGVLRDALLAHALTHDVSATHLVEQGEVFEVTGPMLAPDGRLPMIRTVWIILKGETDPRFVTLKPVWR